MKYKNLGKSGLKVSILSYGSWVTFGNQMQVSHAKNCLAAAYDHGVNFFDNAETYAFGMSEIIMGKAIKQLSWPRDSYIVSSKVYFGSTKEKLPTQVGLNRKHLIEACDAALKRLQLDYLDLYFCHRPDPTTPIEEVVETMTALIRQGKIFYWGTSEWSVQEIMEAYGIARERNLIPPTMEQPQYSMLWRERVESEYKRLYETIGLGITTWSTLASGLLTGKYNNGIPEGSRLSLTGYDWLRKSILDEGGENLKKTRKLTELAAELGIPLPNMAIAWALKNPDVSTVIMGASKVEQIESNLKSLDYTDVLTADVLQSIEEILDNKPS